MTSGPDAEDFQAAASFVLLLRQSGIRNLGVLRAMEQVPRVPFLDDALLPFADDDMVLPIACGQTMLAPTLVARLLEALGPVQGKRMLLVGAGTGYVAAILARLGAAVIAMERWKALADGAQERLARLGYASVRVVWGDGLQGYPAAAPFDAIVVAAALDSVPWAFTEQLRLGGVLIAPIGGRGDAQMLTRGVRTQQGIDLQPLFSVRVQAGESGTVPSAVN